MDISFFVMTIIYIRFVQRFLQTSQTMPREEKLLLGTQFALGAVAGLSFFTPKYIDQSLEWTWKLGLVVCLYVCYTVREQRLPRMLIQAIFPFVVVTLLSDLLKLLFPSFHDDYDDTISLIGMAALTWLIAFTIYTSRQRKALDKEREERERERQINEAAKAELERLVSERTAEITRQKEELQEALSELKAVQNQLIQQEKLASLGELTAGIAHEIQNPLNFVNNFSEVSAELVTELLEEREKGLERDEGLELELLNDLTQNLQKITHHGGRASSIVKGMLQHSRASTGQREPTDLNALADEYLKLAYHGLRAKDKTFNARFDIMADPSIGKVSVVPQDIGRVLLNMYNNAFYATQQRRSEGRTPGDPVKLNQPGYQPTVTVRTECAGEMVRIYVGDNGTGMTEAVRVKIFQPFFTTKPTGEGTGLGLSLAHDIITKGHGGTVEVESQEGEGTTFIVELPA